MKKGKLSASMMCASLDKIFYYLTEFKESKLEYLHIDIMDGDFVPNLALGTDYVKSLRRIRPRNSARLFRQKTPPVG